MIKGIVIGITFISLLVLGWRVDRQWSKSCMVTVSYGQHYRPPVDPLEQAKRQMIEEFRRQERQRHPPGLWWMQPRVTQRV